MDGVSEHASLEVRPGHGGWSREVVDRIRGDTIETLSV
jgi:hypothetical protein